MAPFTSPKIQRSVYSLALQPRVIVVSAYSHPARVQEPFPSGRALVSLTGIAVGTPAVFSLVFLLREGSAWNWEEVSEVIDGLCTGEKSEFRC